MLHHAPIREGLTSLSEAGYAVPVLGLVLWRFLSFADILDGILRLYSSLFNLWCRSSPAHIHACEHSAL